MRLLRIFLFSLFHITRREELAFARAISRAEAAHNRFGMLFLFIAAYLKGSLTGSKERFIERIVTIAVLTKFIFAVSLYSIWITLPSVYPFAAWHGYYYFAVATGIFLGWYVTSLDKTACRAVSTHKFCSTFASSARKTFVRRVSLILGCWFIYLVFRDQLLLGIL
jgi:hypothetical protein